MTDCATQSTRDGRLGTESRLDKRAVILHAAVILIGGIALVANSLHSNIWFEESYSIAVSQHSFGEIFSLSSFDVHPVLYYYALHVLGLLTGGSIVAFRMFSVLGAIVLSILGLTHLSRDYGSRTGIMFSALALLLPWSLYAALQIRMYSWLAVAMTLAIVYALRIASAIVSKTAVPLRFWVVLFVSCVVSAYLHYYGAIAACVVQAYMLFFLIKSKAGTKEIRIWVIGAIALAIALVPFALVASSQLTFLDANSFWSHFDYAKSSSKIFAFPFDSPELGNYTSLLLTSATGEVPEESDMKACFNLTVSIIALTMAASCVGIASAFSFGAAMGEQDNDKGISPGFEIALVLPIAIVLAVCAIAATISFWFFDVVLYYRYAAGLIGPIAFVMAYSFARTRKAALGVAACLLCVACGCVSYNSAYTLSHSDHNGAVHELYENMLEEARANNGGEEPLVVGTSVSTSSMVAMSEPRSTIQYIAEDKDPQYKAYEPQLIAMDDAAALLDDYKGAVLVVGSAKDAEDLAGKYGGRVVDYHNVLQVYANAYSNGWFDFAIVVFE